MFRSEKMLCRNAMSSWPRLGSCWKRPRRSISRLLIPGDVVKCTSIIYYRYLDFYDVMLNEQVVLIHPISKRKDTWTDSDINRFTDLYREDIALEQAEMKAQSSYTKCQEDFDKAHVAYLT